MILPRVCHFSSDRGEIKAACAASLYALMVTVVTIRLGRNRTTDRQDSPFHHHKMTALDIEPQVGLKHLACLPQDILYRAPW